MQNLFTQLITRDRKGQHTRVRGGTLARVWLGVLMGILVLTQLSGQHHRIVHAGGHQHSHHLTATNAGVHGLDLSRAYGQRSFEHALTQADELVDAHNCVLFDALTLAHALTSHLTWQSYADVKHSVAYFLQTGVHVLPLFAYLGRAPPALMNVLAD